MIATGLIEARDQVSATRTGGTGAHTEVARELRLACGGKRRSLLVTHANPFDITSSHRVSERIQRVANESEYVLDANSFESADQNLSYRLGHARLLGIVVATLWPVEPLTTRMHTQSH
jgi:hypothetical protein